MAYRILNKKFPSEVNPKKSLGYGLNFNSRNVFNPIYETKEQVKNNLINYLLTNKKERIFNNKFGANLRKLLFEGIKLNQLSKLESLIEKDLKKYFPLIKIIELKLNSYPDENKINFIFKYKMNKYNIEDEINIIIQ